jgi:hypothetical protein
MKGKSSQFSSSHHDFNRYQLVEDGVGCGLGTRRCLCGCQLEMWLSRVGSCGPGAPVLKLARAWGILPAKLGWVEYPYILHHSCHDLSTQGRSHQVGFHVT